MLRGLRIGEIEFLLVGGIRDGGAFGFGYVDLEADG